jgi:hypothetical protein
MYILIRSNDCYLAAFSRKGPKGSPFSTITILSDLATSSLLKEPFDSFAHQSRFLVLLTSLHSHHWSVIIGVSVKEWPKPGDSMMEPHPE